MRLAFIRRNSFMSTLSVVKESKHLLPLDVALFSKGKQKPTDLPALDLDEVLKNYPKEFLPEKVPANFNGTD